MNEEEIKKKFIVDENYFEREKIPVLAQRIMPFCRVAKNGRVIFEKNLNNNTLKITLILVARWIGSQLDKNISAEVNTNEISDVTGLPLNIISARMAEIVERNWAQKKSKGTYAIHPYQIQNIIEKLDDKFGDKK